MFLFYFIGRFLEAYSKSKTADAVSLLGNLRPDEALLVVHASDEDMGVDSSFLYGVGNPIGEKDPSNTDYPDNRPWKTRKIDTDLLEVGDVISVVRGSSPPADGIVVSGQSQFDESSLTGESRLVHKSEGTPYSSELSTRDKLSTFVSKALAVIPCWIRSLRLSAKAKPVVHQLSVLRI